MIIDPPAGSTEITELRTLRSKTFDLGNGKRRAITRIRPVHVPSSVQAWEAGLPFTWNDPDPEVELRDGFIQVKNAWYRLQVDIEGQFRYRVVSRRAGMHELIVSLERLNGSNPTLTINPQRQGNRIVFPDVVPGITFILVCKPARVELIKRITSPTAPKDFVWRIARTGNDLVRGRLIGNDNADGLERQNETLRKRFKRGLEMQRNIQDLGTINGRQVVLLRERWTGRTFQIDDTTRIKTPSTEVVYPVEIDPDITEPIAADADDGCTTNATTWTNEYHYYYGDVLCPYYDNWPGWRFTSVAVPQGATIDLANLKLNVNKAGGPGSLAGSFIYADDVDDAAGWSSSSRPNQITKTTAKFTIGTSFNTTGLKTCDVTSIVQEIVDRASWVSGNDIRFAALAGTSERRAYFDDYASVLNTEAVLEIDYTEAGGATTILPQIMSHYYS